MVVPQSTVRSELSEKHKDRNGSYEILWPNLFIYLFIAVACLVAHTWGSVILGRTIINTLGRLQQHDQ